MARAVLPGVHQEHHADIGDGPVELAIELRPPHPRSPTCDLVDLVVTQDGQRRVVATYDGRYLSTEVACSFTGRVAGVYAVNGELRVDRFEERDL